MNAAQSAGMHIEAVRLREVGVFRSGQQLAGFGPGLNVFAGANELGKSTVFRALRVLFSEPHTANNKTVRELRPAAGGAPLIECDFVCAGQRWQLTKQYLAGKSAELKRRDGEAVYRGADVESVLDGLLLEAFGARSAVPLLWVGQGDGFAPPVPDPETRQTIEQLVRDEAQAVSGGAQLVALHDTVRRQLFDLVTEKARNPKAGGVYRAAIDECENLREWHQAAMEKVEASERRRLRLAEIEQQLTALSDPAHQSGQNQRVTDLREELEAARQARIKADLATERVKGLTAVRLRAQQELQRFADLANERADLHKRRNELITEEREAGAVISAAQAAHQAGLEQQGELNKRREDLQNRRLIAQRSAHRLSLEDQIANLQARIDKATALTAEQQQIDQRYKAIAIDEATLEQLETMHADAAALEHQIAATAPTISFAYESNRKGEFQIEGATVADGAKRLVDRPVTITVPGVGAISVVPSSRDGREDPASRLDEVQAAIREQLTKAKLHAIEDARAAVRQRREFRSQLDARRSLYQSVAPEGTAALEQERDAIAKQIAELSEAAEGADQLDVTQIEAEASTLTAKLAQCDVHVRGLADRLAQLREHEAARNSERALLDSREAAIVAELPSSPTACNDHRKALEAAVDDAGDALNAATRELAAWAEVVPGNDVVEATARQLADLEAEQRLAQQRTADLREEMRGLAGALERDLEDGIVAASQDLTERLEYAEARLTDLSEHVAALELLERELASERERQSNLVAGPVSQRLADLARNVLPDGRFQLGQDLAVVGLQRGTRDESSAQLSGGTREQIAVLARLAFAGLLAENGHAVPLLLDDALVFSDDQRLDQVFATLAAASHQHQIIILTCHARSFAPLVERHEATSLQLVPWP